ncbi:MAG: ParB family transcriptional regulator, chromosome partitioning protein [Frankiaceae bacterium]|nr:ParB family transcriptional regulator, chromosome partitioning protein [Frankiaceae bacterium]
MSTRQRGLGRGLGALIAPPDTGLRPAQDRRVAAGSPSDVFFNGGNAPVGRPPTEPSAAAVADPPAAAAADRVAGELRMVPVGAIVPNPRQPRTVFDDDALAELTASIREVGVLQPVVVRPIERPDGGTAARFELVMGERRWRASQAAGRAEIPAVIRTTTDDALLRDALLENVHRSELNPLEEAAAYSQLLNDFGCTHEQLAERLGSSRSHLTNTMRLLNLSPAVQRRVAARVLSAGHARALLALSDAAAQDALATRIVAEGLSVRSVEELVAVATPSRRRPATARSPHTLQPELADIADALTERLDTRVKISMGRTKGRITVEFAGPEDLQRILAALGAAPPA